MSRKHREQDHSGLSKDKGGQKTCTACVAYLFRAHTFKLLFALQGKGKQRGQNNLSGVTSESTGGIHEKHSINQSNNQSIKSDENSCLFL